MFTFILIFIQDDVVEIILTITTKYPLHESLIMANTQNPFRQSSH